MVWIKREFEVNKWKRKKRKKVLEETKFCERGKNRTVNGNKVVRINATTQEDVKWFWNENEEKNEDIQDSWGYWKDLWEVVR